MHSSHYKLENIIKAIATDHNSDVTDLEYIEQIERVFAEEKQHNGWTNYATWRINLEMVDGEADAIRDSGDVFDTVHDLADHLRQMVDDHFELMLDDVDPEGRDMTLMTMHSYSDAFISEVDYNEIATNMAQDNPEFVKEKLV